MKRRMVKRTWLWAGLAAVFLLSPVFWLLPGRGVTVKNMSVRTLPYPCWTLGASNGHQFVYDRHDPDMFSHRKVYMTRSICCGTLLVSIRGREVPDMWE